MDFRKRLKTALRSGRDAGDLLPSLLSRQTCDFYDNLTLVTIYFGILLFVIK